MGARRADFLCCIACASVKLSIHQTKHALVPALQGMLSTMLATMQNPAVLGVAALHSAFTHLYLYGIGVRGLPYCCSLQNCCTATMWLHLMSAPSAAATTAQQVSTAKQPLLDQQEA
jgi:hypothetical protein